ncbi:hypothetical protein [Blautia producta]|uniref:hypothetical protein n=1 Tax=Blautia producta TaxID=33035 RepID=UPI0035669DA9
MDLGKRIDKLKTDIDECIKEECKNVEMADNPRKEIEMYFKHMRWAAPELSAYIKIKC